ncbi:hypothetical protein MJO29_013098 [Puccinia striiformis f. sp. tritici]|uniref:Uncharacterized protein n=1 Tax=Puccinia striiformis f. sp. tritici PST-78 TaxID=1165861 RepID=A0A0L0V247_9BASI|nr:hypothetical protein Pst134EB_025204 [Puccinia striiformis f. sp. tritici]KAI7943254.1 hypothetical protein MJO29_013098 [Puccinia striiformis f. sp. tritici]KNE93256.1 hypothetical protein PSTG_13368 [Puccinia striiformis f. sp. tritici PST-78]
MQTSSNVTGLPSKSSDPMDTSRNPTGPSTSDAKESSDVMDSSDAMEHPSTPTGPSSVPSSHPSVPVASLDPILAQITDKMTQEKIKNQEKHLEKEKNQNQKEVELDLAQIDQEEMKNHENQIEIEKQKQKEIEIEKQENNELDLNTDKVVNRVVEKYVVPQEALDEEALEIEDNKILEKCLDLLQSQFAEEDAEEEEDEETKKRINEVTEKIALENLEEANKVSKAEEERDNNLDSEEQDGDGDDEIL